MSFENLSPSFKGKAEYLEKTVDRLRGLIEGISIDDELDDDEILLLKNWIDEHPRLHGEEPFASLIALLKDCLEDGIIDEDERDEISEWCASFLNDSPFAGDVTEAIRRLHGALSGILIDDVITDDEILNLQDWLYDYESLKDSWPFNDLWALLDRILEDGVIDDEEREEFKEFCSYFSEKIVKNPDIQDGVYIETWMRTGCPIFKPLIELCNHDHQITFTEKTFCFTGPAKSGPRTVLHQMLEEAGGVPIKTANLKLDYLIIGAQSSPSWIYSTYGRKIETVINNRKANKCNTTLIYENDFLKQIEGHLKNPDIQKYITPKKI